MEFLERSLEFRAKLRTFILGWLLPERLAAEKFREELNATLQEHWKGNPLKVHELIFENWDEKDSDGGSEITKSNNYIVYIDHELGVDWLNDGSLDDKSAECVSLAEAVGARRCSHLPREQVLELKRLVGQAILAGIRGDKRQACKLAEDAAQFLKDRTVERSRIWTLMSAHWLLITLVSIIGFGFWIFQGKNLVVTEGFGLSLAVCGGLIGAYLSVIQKAGNGNWDAASGFRIHALEVFSKLSAGAAFGAIAFALSQSSHAPPSIKAITPDSYSMFLFGLGAGLFERTIPKMISKYSGVIEEPKEESK